MRSTSLPLLDCNSSLDDALQTMRKAKRSGVVVQTGTKFHLHTAKAVFSAIDKRSGRELRDLKGLSIHVPSVVLTKQATSPVRLSTQILLSSLNKSGKSYGVLSIPTSGEKRVGVYGRKNDIAYVEPTPTPRPKPKPR